MTHDEPGIGVPGNGEAQMSLGCVPGLSGSGIPNPPGLYFRCLVMGIDR